MSKTEIKKSEETLSGLWFRYVLAGFLFGVFWGLASCIAHFFSLPPLLKFLMSCPYLASHLLGVWFSIGSQSFLYVLSLPVGVFFGLLLSNLLYVLRGPDRLLSWYRLALLALVIGGIWGLVSTVSLMGIDNCPNSTTLGDSGLDLPAIIYNFIKSAYDNPSNLWLFPALFPFLIVCSIHNPNIFKSPIFLLILFISPTLFGILFAELFALIFFIIYLAVRKAIIAIKRG